MGWETLAIVGFQAISGAQDVKAAKRQARAGVQEAENQSMSLADDTVRRSGSLRNSYLSAGLDLEGGPMQMIAGAFAKGRTDIGRIEANANAQSKNIVSAARSKMMKDIAGSVAGSAAGATAFSAIGSTVNSGIDSLGQKAGSLFDPSPTGPYMTPFNSGFYGS